MWILKKTLTGLHFVGNSFIHKISVRKNNHNKSAIIWNLIRIPEKQKLLLTQQKLVDCRIAYSRRTYPKNLGHPTFHFITPVGHNCLHLRINSEKNEDEKFLTTKTALHAPIFSRINSK